MHRLRQMVIGLGILVLPCGVAASAKPLFPNPQFTTLQPVRSVSADFDGDGRTDLAITTKTNTVVVFHGQGDGTFSGETSLGVGGTGIVTGDFNGDGFTDLATTAANMYPGHGDGTFGSAVSTAIPALRDIAAGDLNGDGVTDLVAVDATGCRALLGTSSGVFQPQAYAALGPDPRVAAVGDFDADGRLDLAFAWNWTGPSGYSMKLMRGLGTGAFTLRAQFDFLPQVAMLTMGDLDGDGRADVVAPTAQSLLVYFSDPTGFSQAGPYSGAASWA